MVKVTHQHIGMNRKTEPSWQNAQQVEKMLIRALVWKDLAFSRPRLITVVSPVLNFEPQWSSHEDENYLESGRRNVKCFRRDPVAASLLIQKAQRR
jgi:hypothetical protein